MPNHVKNVLTFHEITKEEKEFILNTITQKAEDDSGYWINFDKIIPEPQTEDECPDGFKVNKDSHVMKDKDRPWFNWYDWHLRYWGTKWNAYDCYSLTDMLDEITLVFNTAWTTPLPIIEQLRLMGFEFTLNYADEDYGSNCGIIEYKKTDTGKMGFYSHNEKDMKEDGEDPVQFAEDLWEEY